MSAENDMADEGKEPEVQAPARRFGRVRMAFLFGLLLLISTQTLNHTGFCYADMKYLSEREIIDRFLFKEKANSMTLEEKKRAVREKYNGAKYPACCRILGEVDEQDLFWMEGDEAGYLIEKTLFGLFLYELILYRPHSKDTMKSPPYPETTIEAGISKYPYQEIRAAITSCGGAYYWNIQEFNLADMIYREKLADNKRRWSAFYLKE